MNEKTTLLYAIPSFVQGVGSLLDPLGLMNQYNTSASEEEADCDALLSDWEVVGDELRSAMSVNKVEYNE